MKPHLILIEPDATQLARKVVQELVQTAEDCVERQNLFTLAISGGSTPRVLHRLLTEPPWRERMPWHHTHIFWVDERCVPITDPASNYGNAKIDFLDRVAIPAMHIHPMPGEQESEKAALFYRKEIQKVVKTVGDGFPVFDLIMLGMGEDGHTASLFPGDPALEETRRWVTAVKGGHSRVTRLTLTLPVLNHADRIWFLISGSEKADIMRTLFSETSPVLPVDRIQPLKGRISWLLDEPAARKIRQAVRP
jgi:6-phosphogluconolactonase